MDFTDADYRQMANAGIICAIGGLAMAPVSAMANPQARTDPREALGEQIMERLPFREAEQPSADAGPMEFGGEIPEQDLVGRASLPRDIQQAFAADRLSNARSTYFGMDDSPEPFALMHRGLER